MKPHHVLACWCIPAALWLAVATAGSAAESAPPPELHGILVLGREQRFALVASGGERSGWAARGETFAGWKVDDYLPEKNAIVLSRDGDPVTVCLKQASAIAGESEAPGAKTTLAEADDVLTKMKFDAMWDRIVDEQRKSIVGVMRQQTSAELAKHGVPPAELDALVEKMGDAVMAGLQPDVMRRDFARIFAEVYTKDELRGMADFYETSAGKAWAAKQPEVQQKMMQALMPRVMQGMPAAQKIAADYMQRRAAAAAPAPAKR